ncbi:MAG: hypothetical protein M3P31_06255, partial [Actinomycetota bacterium]|nr:hypothetical protein [Actinomycetota bacterium]
MRFKPLPGHLQAELVQTAKGGQIRAGEGSVQQRRGPSVEASELPSLKDLDPHPGNDAPKIPTLSSVKSR